MPNALVSLLREQSPDATADLSDEQLTLLIGDRQRGRNNFALEAKYPDFRDEYLRLKSRESPGLVSETGSAAAAGLLDIVPRMGYGALAAAAGGVGLDSAENFLLRQAQRNAQEAVERTAGRAVTRVEDIPLGGPLETATRAVQWAVPTFAENVPQLGLTVGVPLALSATLGPQVGIPARMALQGLAAAGTGTALNVGDIYADVTTKPGIDRDVARVEALKSGVAGGLLDALGATIPILKLSRVGRAAIGTVDDVAAVKIVKGVLDRGGVTGAITTGLAEGGVEALTETAQEALAIHAEEATTGRKLPEAEVRTRLLNSFFAGGLVGGGVGGALGVIPTAPDAAPVPPSQSPAAVAPAPQPQPPTPEVQLGQEKEAQEIPGLLSPADASGITTAAAAPAAVAAPVETPTTEEIPNAQETRTAVEETSRQEAPREEADRSVRLWDATQDRVEAPSRKVAPVENLQTFDMGGGTPVFQTVELTAPVPELGARGTVGNTVRVAELQQAGYAMPAVVPPRAPRTITLQSQPVRQTDTPEFKRWFGASKIKAPSGEPLVVYRGEGEGSEFTVFNRNKTRENGFFFTPEENIAAIYSRGRPPRKFYVRAEKVLDLTKETPANAKWIRNWSKSFDEWIDRATGEERDPVEFVQEGRLFDYEGTWSGERWKDLQASAEADGYDAVILPDWDNATGMFPSVVVFKPENIKSATDNVGAFDRANPDITRSRPAILRGSLQMRQTWGRVVSALLARGIDVQASQALLNQLEVGGVIAQMPSGARYVSLVLDNLHNPTDTDVRVVTHELIHGLEMDLSPDQRAALRRAVEGLWHGMTADQRTRWQARNRSLQTTDPEVLWREALAVMLEDQGLDAGNATSIAERVLRFLKETFLQVAGGFLRAIGYTNQSDAIALRLFQSRLDGVLNERSPMSLSQALGGRRLTGREKFFVFHTGRAGDIASRTPDDVQQDVANDLRPQYLFSQPVAGQEPVGVVGNPAQVVNTKLAALNAGLTTQVAASMAMTNTRLAQRLQIAGPGLVPLLRETFGLPDYESLKGAAVATTDPQTGQPVASTNPDTTIRDLQDPASIAQAQRKAKIDAQDAIETVEKKKTHANDLAAQLQRQLDHRWEGFLKAHQKYADAEGLTALIYGAVRQLLSAEWALADRAGQQLGAITQQLRALDPRKTIAEFNAAYGPALTKLLTSLSEKPRNLFDWLDAMLNEANIDFDRSAVEIEDEIARRIAAGGHADLQALIEDTPESRALLATLVAYAKSDAVMRAKIIQRRVKNVSERLSLQRELDALAQVRGQTAQAARDLRKQATLEERARSAYNERQQEIIDLDTRLTQQREVVEVADAVLPVLLAADEELARNLDARPLAVWENGMQYHTGRMVADSEDESEDPAQIPDVKTLRLDAGKPTDRATLNGDMEAMREYLTMQEAAGVNDPLVRRVRADLQALEDGGVLQDQLRKVDSTFAGLAMGSVSRVAEAIGTPLGRAVAQRINRYTDRRRALINEGVRRGYRWEAARDRVIDILSRGRPRISRFSLRRWRLPTDQFYRLFFDPAAQALEDATGWQEQGLTREQATRQVIRRLMLHWQSDVVTAPWVEGRQDEVAAAMERFMKDSADEGAFWFDEAHRDDPGVADPALRVQDVTGKMVRAVRAASPQGLYTFSRTLARRLRKDTYAALIREGQSWAEMADEIKQLPERVAQGGLNAVRNRLATYFADPEIWNFFLGGMARNASHSVFDAPALADGVTRAEADPAKVLAAYQETPNGDVVGFIERMYAAHGGETPIEAYVVDMLNRMNSYYEKLAEILDPQESGITMTGLRRLIPSHAIDARTLNRWPTAWSERLVFDHRTNENTAAKIAGQQAFGRDTEALDNAWQAMVRDMDAQIAELDGAEKDIRDALPGIPSKQFHRVVEGRFVSRHGERAGRNQLARLRALQSRRKLLGEAEKNLRAYFQSPHTDVGALHLGTMAVGTLAGMAVNNPGTALLTLGELFTPILRFGLSAATLKQVARNWKVGGEGLAGAIGQALFKKTWTASRLWRAYNELRLQDPLIGMEFSKQFLPDQGRRDEDRSLTGPGGEMTRYLRAWQRAWGFGLNRQGAAAQFPVLRPLGGQTFASNITHAANTIGLWQRVEDMVLRTIEFLDDNAAASNDPGFDASAAALGLKGLDAASWEQLREDMARHGLDLATMARAASRRMDDTRNPQMLLTNPERSALMGIATNDLASEANLATMNPRTFTSGLARVLLTFWGWPIRRSATVLRAFRDPRGALFTEDGKIRWGALAQGFGALGLMSAAGLAWALLIDTGYHEWLLGKRRNLRTTRELLSAIGRGDADEAFYALLETSNRIGTFGILGEVANSFANSSSMGGGDNRGLSLDSRVFAASSMISLFRSVSSLIAQGGQANYQQNIRPLIAAVGGQGALQYMQLANRMLGLDNAESRAVARINAQNYLRVGGRIADLEVRQLGSTGAATPNEMSAAMARMTQAAYVGDRGGFIRAWREAVAQARRLGKDDPAEYVKDSFRARHPLRSIFVHLSEGDYRRLLTVLPTDGQRDVQDAVRWFNAFGQSLDIQPYFGSKGTTRRKAGGRARALNFAPAASRNLLTVPSLSF